MPKKYFYLKSNAVYNSSAKNAAALAEKMCRKRNAKKIVEEYNEVSETNLNMKETLVNMNEEVNEYEKQLQSIKQKITVWAQNVYKMEENKHF